MTSHGYLRIKRIEMRVVSRGAARIRSSSREFVVVTKDGGLLSAHGDTHFSATYLSTAGNFLNTFTALSATVSWVEAR